jgi:hypothetical protein
MKRPIAIGLALTGFVAWLKPRRYIWLTAVLVCLLSCATPYLRRAWNKRDVSGFAAVVHTKSISFTLGHWTDSAGIFVDGITRVNLTFPAGSVIAAGKVPVLQSQTTDHDLNLRNVRLQFLDASEGSQVTIDVQAGALLFAIQRKEPSRKGKGPARQTEELPLTDFATVLLDRKSAVDRADRNLVTDKDNQELLIGRKADGEVFSFSMRFLPGQKLTAEKGIPLADRGFVYFQYESRSAIMGSGNLLKVQEPLGTYPITDGLKLEKLQDAQIQELTPHVGAAGKSHVTTADVDWLDASVEGRSDQILLVSGGRVEAKTPLSRARFWPDSLPAAFQALGAMVSAAVALYGLIFKTFVPRQKKTG